MLFRSKKPNFSITLARDVLESIYDECDKYDVDETGGRLIGTYRSRGSHFDIQAKGIIEPGPNAERTATYFMQDGEYQERRFREIEAVHPEIEHLGNWHTHHVNGYPTLSSGDKETYFKIVNHKQHNTNFFYALLVVSKNRTGGPRYSVKHFMFCRGDNNIYEIPPDAVQLIDSPPLLSEKSSELSVSLPGKTGYGAANPERVKDQEFLSEFYPDFKALLAKDIGALYWKGSLKLIDGSRADVVAMEDPENAAHSYTIASSSKSEELASILGQYKKRKFRAARHAVLHLERDLNQALYREKKG